MGAGIAQVLLEGGCEVVGRESTTAALERARGRIEAGLARRVEKGVAERRGAAARRSRAWRSRAISRGSPDCGLVIEAIAEELGAEARAVRRARRHLRRPGRSWRRTPRRISVTAIAAGERAAGALPRAALLQPGAADAARRGRARRAHRRGALRRRRTSSSSPAASRPCAATTRPGFVVNRLLDPGAQRRRARARRDSASSRPRSTPR